ncbi:MAG: hypothetical protein R2798_04120 [Chitinophagales bacterium]|nr:hypothetical protein [Bacteroidota bacterium]
MIRNNFFILGFALLLLPTVFFTACNTTNENLATKSSSEYFALQNYFNTIIEEYEKEKTPLEKTIIYQNESQTQVINEANWAEELQLFTASDINKPAWRDAYSIDTVQKAKEKEVTYTAKKKDLKTQKMILRFSGNNLQHLTIQNRQKNVMYETLEDLNFQASPLQYSCEVYQKMLWFSPTTFTIKAQKTAP